MKRSVLFAAGAAVMMSVAAGTKDRGFTIYGKPAAEVLKKWSGQAQ